MELSTLSWALLVADRATAYGNFFLVMALLSAMIGGVALVIFYVESDTHVWKETNLRRWYGWGVGLLFAAVMVFGVVPDSKVILQVAAIELGDDVLQSVEFKTILDMYLK